jgi:23S rRNA (uracil1939-C5)-methyltransferase
MKNGDIIELKIEKIVYSGAGLGFYDDIAVFVKKTVPEDIVRARLTKLKKSYAEAH